MANFWSKRKDNATDASEYLRTTDDVSRPMALLLSLLGFLVVFALLFSLFLSGRWAYQRFVEDDLATNGTTIQAGDPSLDGVKTAVDNSETADVVDDTTPDKSADTTDSSTTSDSISTNDTTVVAGSNDDADAVAVNTPATNTPTTTTPATGNSPETITRTGPGAVGLLAAAVGATGSAVYSAIKNRR